MRDCRVAKGDRSTSRVWAITLPLFVLISVVLGVLWWLDREEWREGVQEQVALTAEQAALRLEDYVDARLLIVEAFARTSAQQPEWGPEQRRVRAEVAQEQFGGFQAINWVGVDSRIRTVTPLESNRGALGRHVLDHPVAHEAFRRARETGEPTMTAPLDLFQGGRGFATYFPYESDDGQAYVNGVFRIRPLVETALRGGVLEDYTIELTDGDEPLLSFTEGEASDDRPTAASGVELLDHTWTLAVTPREHLWSSMEDRRPGLVYGIAFLLLALMAWAVHLALLRQIGRARAERERRELELRLERASKMEALGRLAGGVAHDFNNILTAILNSVQLLREPAETFEYGPFAVDTIVDASTRAAELTRQLLTFARHSPSAPVVLDLNDQLVSLRRMLERLLPPSVELEIALDSELPLVKLSQSHVGQIVVNLVVNAADAMPGGGRIDIRTRREEGAVVLEVEDNGAGMDAETRERIFEPFFTTKESGKGTGLGLATVYGLVQGYEGTVDVMSEPGRGTVFEIRLPALAGATVPETKAPSAVGEIVAPKATSARRLLLVEDDDGVRTALLRGLRMMGHEVTEARDGQEAIDVLEGGARFDGVLSDVLMPHVDGIELLEWIREHRPNLPVVLCSGHTGSREVVDDDALTELHGKPFSIETIHEIFDRLWESRSDGDSEPPGPTPASRQ